jgi:hypothetical protein
MTGSSAEVVAEPAKQKCDVKVAAAVVAPRPYRKFRLEVEVGFVGLLIDMKNPLQIECNFEPPNGLLKLVYHRLNHFGNHWVRRLNFESPCR